VAAASYGRALPARPSSARASVGEVPSRRWLQGFLIVAGRDSQQDLIEHVSAEGATRPFKVSPLSRRAAATVIYMELSDGQHSQLGGFFGIPVLLARAIVAWGAQHETHGRQPRESQPACGSSAWLPSMPTAVQCSTNVPLCQRLTRSRISYTRLKRFSIGLVMKAPFEILEQSRAKSRSESHLYAQPLRITPNEFRCKTLFLEGEV
jgi:hypothetical protein